MTAVAAAATVDCSGLVSSILQRFRAVGARIAEEVRGDPATVRSAAQQHQQEATRLAQLSQQARQRSTSLAGSWEGGAYDAYAARTGRVCDQLDRAAQGLQAQAQKLTGAATVLEAATTAMTALLADFDGKAAAMVSLARTANPSAVSAFVQAANNLGQSLVDAGGKVRDDLSRALDVAAGNDPTKPEDDKDDLKFELFKKDSKFGIDKFLGTDDLDEMMGKKPEPTTAAGKLLDKTNVTLWKPDGDGALFEWGAGGKTGTRTDLPGGGAMGAESSWFVGPKGTYDGKLSIDGGDLKGEMGAKVTLADVKGSAYAVVGPATVQANGEAYVGANADANLAIGVHGGSAHAGAFVGGKAEGSIAGDVGGIGAGVNGSLRYGLGAELDAKATWEGGHVQLGFQAGAAVGLGGSVGGTIDIDVPKMWESYEHLDPAGAQALRDGATWVGNTASQAGHAIGDVADWLEGR